LKPLQADYDNTGRFKSGRKSIKTVNFWSKWRKILPILSTHHFYRLSATFKSAKNTYNQLQELLGVDSFGFKIIFSQNPKILDFWL
jgi:hypothetical protein